MNYIGSKYSLLDFIHRTISDFTGYKSGDDYIFADLFAGTGVVGASYRKEGCKVISNDIQYYSYVINKYLIEGSENIDESLISSLDLLDDVDGFIFENYCAGSGSGRNYFTDSNGKKCDAIRIEIERLFNQNLISEEITRITDKRLGMKTQALDALYHEITWDYILVLVNNKHWIAVKHVKEDRFVCYDPNEGKDSDGSTMGKAIENLRKEYVISGLYICI